MSEKEELLAELEKIGAEKKVAVSGIAETEEFHDGEAQKGYLATFDQLLEREKEIKKRLEELQ